ncbi:TetR/AcrR family transcriptional regulator [Streptomyces sp. TS71-3]|uniref:TetR/AcrR family transcriptional regulator n=1 Tax=Streptomyces sp. TS71-3 TaxID=2733862 RepID=UPI001B049E99|nr:TetR/AcrR family transcriptional regulator [Streptomyces sp. TS71-3]GHJ36204.1 TetR family transcriptional regulator [Streptomyces sp. TS71-3]
MAQRVRQGLAEKRTAIVCGARRVFGRDGYTRTSIDAIAKEADVSTRTIYNHFPGGKAEVFRVVVEEGAAQVVQAHLDALDRRLHKVTDLEADLIAFIQAWAEPADRFPDHFAVARQLRAEVGHIPQELVDAWRRSGPQRSIEAAAGRFRELADEGLLDAPDPLRAAHHLFHLTLGEVNDRTCMGALPLPDQERTELITAGVRAFLRGYLPR